MDKKLAFGVALASLVAACGTAREEVTSTMFDGQCIGSRVGAEYLESIPQPDKDRLYQLEQDFYSVRSKLEWPQDQESASNLFQREREIFQERDSILSENGLTGVYTVATLNSDWSCAPFRAGFTYKPIVRIK